MKYHSDKHFSCEISENIKVLSIPFEMSKRRGPVLTSKSSSKSPRNGAGLKPEVKRRGYLYLTPRAGGARTPRNRQECLGSFTQDVQRLARERHVNARVPGKGNLCAIMFAR
jgi:hypothetical protein